MAATSEYATPGSLKALLKPASADLDGVDIILVPGLGTTSPENWPFASTSWLSELPDVAGDVGVYAYQYAPPPTSAKTPWETILMRGYDFLDQLVLMRAELDEDMARDRPIMIVCHSLGGILVKQALCVAVRQSLRYTSMVNNIVGVVFLSTPHQYGNAVTTWSRFRDILEMTTGKTMKYSSSSAEQEGAILVNLAERFDTLRLRTPILSAYELRESKGGLAPLRKGQLLVNRDACTTGAPLETVLGLNLSHHDTCLFTMSADCEGLTKFYKFLDDTLRDAYGLIDRRQQVEYKYATMSSYSPTMSELPLQTGKLQITEWPSNDATEWPSNDATEGTSLSGFELVHSAATKSETSKNIHLPCYLLDTRPQNDDFCGREDILDRLATELLPSKKLVTASNNTLQQFTICGFGGIGKTEIAREFSQRHKAAFDAVFWVVADEIAKLDHQYQQMSLALGLEEASECKNQVVSRELVKGWLSNPRKHLHESEDFMPAGHADSEASWLLVFDNADDPMILADYWPQGSGSILITSRDPLAKSMFTRRTLGLDLAPLSVDESVILFNYLTAASSESGDDTAEKISELLGGVPLAISQMAGIIRRQDLTLEEFLELYADLEEHAALYETKFDTNLVSYRHSISTVWAFEKLKPQARQLLEIMSFMDPDLIEEELLFETASEILADGSSFKKSNYIEARADLLQSSLVQRNKAKQLLSVHRIVQDAILATMDSQKRQSMFDSIVELLWSEWPSALPKPSRKPELPQPKSSGGRLHVGRWPACAAIYPHVLKVHQLWPLIINPPDASSLLFAQLLTEAAWYQKERGRMKHFDGFFDTALSICATSSHPDCDAVLADIYFSLGSIAMDSNDFSNSRIYKEKSLDLVSKICKELDAVDERLYLAFAERGISRMQDKRYKEGESDFKYALEIRKSLGNYVPRSGEANLSWGLLAQGKLEECNALLLESLAGREAALGKNDRESARTGLILYVLGNLRAVEGHWDASYDYHQRAWHHMLETVGERDFYTANITHKIAEHHMRLGDVQKAIELVNIALEIWSVEPNAKKNEIARSTFLKAKLFESTGKAQKANIALRVATRLRKEITNEERDVKTLTTEDFDEIVAFWSR